MSRTGSVARPRLEGTVAVRDGRRLGFAEFGHPNGDPVVWMHGTPGARRQIPFEARAHAEVRGLRIVGVDRPGIGSSTPHVYDDVRDWTADLEMLADTLGIDDMRLIGLSGGAVGLARHAAPLVAVGRLPIGLALTLGIRVARPVAGRILDLYAVVQPEGDKRLLGRPEFRAMFVDDLLNGSRKQVTAPLSDLLLFTRDWGFRLAEVNVPVAWYHGDAAHIVPFRHGVHVVDLLPDAVLRTMEGESHLGGLGLAEDILDTLTALGRD
ncbi:MAG: alpha/beta fold hydrolase [Nocardioides sp.]